MQKYIMTMASIFSMLFLTESGIEHLSYAEQKNIKQIKELTITNEGRNSFAVGYHKVMDGEGPNNVPVLVNKEYGLPDNYKPTDLIYPDVPFLADEKDEKRMMRKEAAYALEELFQAAKKEGVHLAGVSAYRSYSAQKEIFTSNVEKDGFEIASTYSAFPGTSEHETGLAIDISDSRGICPAIDCFGDTKESNWLAEHAHEHGFIVRYPKGKQDITGYKYEPWHFRYVGTSIATEMTNRRITLEEYTNAMPVTN
ncbi:D-alanyl-D-alanine carboxypeptidase family protein [Bacillus sp. V59.32b]|uniref:M15 family metallopeptidase n=1 Tax=Bacillus sp. V59.32b TaxID=1758642 RepID=UPI000E3E859B|nr:M15 family metallopeptidase [Bacillus sp. V59.32b]RFU67080.1 D-alanyl-D-alanine carboxypeptidase family protein [Bacillus sp. V59.32b]